MASSDSQAEHPTADATESVEGPVARSESHLELFVLAAIPMVCFVLSVALTPLRLQVTFGSSERVSPETDRSSSGTAQQPGPVKSDSQQAQAKSGAESSPAQADVIGLPQPAKKPTRQPLTPSEIAQLRLPVPGQPAQAPKSPAPWKAVLDQPAKDLPGFHEVCFRLPDPTKDVGVSREQFEQWFQPVPGAKYRLYSASSSRTTRTGMDGVLRWMAPWKPDMSLILGVSQSVRFQLHLIAAQGSVTLVHNGTGGKGWMAYRSRREEGSLPIPLQLVAQVQPDMADSSSLSVGIRYQNHELILYRGDLVLMRVPLSGPPQLTYFSGNTVFHELKVQRTVDFPLAKKSTERTKGSTPDPLNWKFVKKPFGEIRLQADKAVELHSIQPNVAFARLPLAGLFEARVLLEDVLPGCGVGLGDERGGYGDLLRFVRNLSTGQTCAVLSRSTASEVSLGHPHETLVPCVGRRVWLRFAAGAGSFRAWISHNGQHWVQLEGTGTRLSGVARSLCLSLPAGTHLRVLQVESRRQKRIVGLADSTILKACPSFRGHCNDISSWLVHATSAQPGNVTWDQWRSACAVRALLDGASPTVAKLLLMSLLEQAASSSRPLPERLAILREGFALLGSASSAGRKARAQLMAVALKTNDVLPVSNRSIVAVAGSRSVVSDEPTIRRTLLHRLYSGHWVETLELCEQLQFFGQSRRASRFVDWARNVATRRLPGSAADSRLSRRYPNWRHPYVEELNKETYNVLAELRAILNTKSFPDAARMITTVAGENLHGVAPSGSDRQHLLSLEAAIRQAVRDHSGLREVIRSKYGQLAQLRIRSAMKQGNISAVKLASIQFEATPAAAEARQWLGDRALVMGRFAEALAHYRRASTSGSVAIRRDVKARVRLVSAMVGTAETKLPETGLKLGDVQLAVADFQSLVGRLRAKPLAKVLVGGEDSKPQPPPLHKLKSGRRLKWKWAVGIHPNRQITSGVNKYDVPWVTRQLATVVSAGHAYVSNRFHVARVDLKSGKVAWVSQTPARHKPMYSRNWSLIPTRPLVTQDSVIVRTMHGRGPLIRCLERSTGKQRWIIEPVKDDQFVSDVFALLDDVATFAIRPTGRSELTLQLLRLDAETGEVLGRIDILRLRSSWTARQVCQVTATDEGAIASLGGAVFAIDSAGKLRWLRQQVVVPTDIDATWVRQVMQPPTVVGSMAVLVTPGVRSVESVDADTGKLIWRSLQDDVQKCVGVTDDTIVIRTADSFVGLKRENGQQLWIYPFKASMVCDGEICSGRYLVFARRLAPTKSRPAKQPVPQLIWYDLVRREVAGQCVLAGLPGAAPALGPFVHSNGKWWAYFGQTPVQTDRELIELVPDGNRKVDALVAEDSRDKRLHAVAPRPIVATMFSRWRNLQGVVEGRSDSSVLTMRSSAKSPATIAVPLGAAKQLVLEAEDASSTIGVVVRSGGRVLWERKPTLTPTRKNKRKRKKRKRRAGQAKAQMVKSLAHVTVPLQPARNGWVTVQVTGKGFVIWKKLETR